MENIPMSQAVREPIMVSPEDQARACIRLERLRQEGVRYEATAAAALAQPIPPKSLDIWLLSTTLVEYRRQMQQACEVIWRLDALDMRLAFAWGAGSGALFTIAVLKLIG